MKQYLRSKIVRWGYRIWKLCDAGNAYVLNFDVYTEAGTKIITLLRGHENDGRVL